MANYIPHHTKKKQILSRKELALERLIASGESRHRVLLAAEEVRAERIRVLRSRRSSLAPTGDADRQYQELDDRIEQLLTVSLDSILAEFGGGSSDEATRRLLSLFVGPD